MLNIKGFCAHLCLCVLSVCTRSCLFGAGVLSMFCACLCPISYIKEPKTHDSIPLHRPLPAPLGVYECARQSLSKASRGRMCDTGVRIKGASAKMEVNGAIYTEGDRLCLLMYMMWSRRIFMRWLGLLVEGVVDRRDHHWGRTAFVSVVPMPTGRAHCQVVPSAGRSSHRNIRFPKSQPVM